MGEDGLPMKKPKGLGSNPIDLLETACCVFTSSGWSKKHNTWKISLHFIWPNLKVSAREAKQIRNTTLQYLQDNQDRKEPANMKDIREHHLHKNAYQRPESALVWEEVG